MDNLRQQEKQQDGKGLKFISALLIMYVLTGVMLLILAALLYRFQLSENLVSVGIMAVYIIAGFIGGLIAGKRIGRHRFFWGMLAGTVYFMILFAGSAALNHGAPENTIKMAAVWVMCACAGMIGGMLSRSNAN